MEESETFNKCQNRVCNCEVDESEVFCSEYCENVQDDEIYTVCECGHLKCSL